MSSQLWGFRVPCFWQVLGFGDPGLGGLFFFKYWGAGIQVLGQRVLGSPGLEGCEVWGCQV